ncbi:thioredoxin family protein [Cohnella sp. GCM10012308]|uniref:thioredoxin family protein n=1 Tax=Cohnella sp. GCM10012308 TaxID=3317329 RepID=UPI00361D925B
MLIEVVSAGPGCSICQKALSLAKQAAAEFSQIEIRELHVVEAFERLQELNVFSAGAILINGSAEFRALPKLPELRARVYAWLDYEESR